MNADLEALPPDGSTRAERPDDRAFPRGMTPVDLAYDEFCRRREAGEPIDVNGFCARHPECESSLRALLLFDLYLGDRPSQILMDEVPQTGTQPQWADVAPLVPGYQVVGELGQGQLGRVFLTLDQEAGNRPVVLKASRFRSLEARTLGRLHHDNVMPVHWARYDEATNLQVVCMPYLGRATLHDVITRLYPKSGQPAPRRGDAILEAIRGPGTGELAPDAQLPGPALAGRSFLEAVIRLGITLADAIAFLHEQNVYHCDLKPSNILVTPLGRPLLLDFNLVRRKGQSYGRIGGTVPYIAPEPIRALLNGVESSDAEAATADLFSLGVILHELLTGYLPFPLPTGPDPSSREGLTWLLARQQLGVPSLRLHDRTIPRGLDHLVRRCLAFDARDRPASAREVAHRLRHLLPWSRARLAGSAAVLALGLGGWAWGAGWIAPGDGPAPHRPGAVPASVEPAPEDERPRHRAAGRAALEEGHRLSVNGRPDQAEPLLRSAVDRYRKVTLQTQALGGPESWEDPFALVRALMLLNRPAEAADYLGQVEKLWRKDGRLAVAVIGTRSPLAAAGLAALDPRGRILACRSACCARLNKHKEALLFGKEALKAGYRSPPLLASMAHSASRLGQFDLAQGYLTEALQGDPTLHQALLLEVRLALRQNLRPPHVPVSDRILAASERVIESMRRKGLPEHAEPHLVAAQLHAQASSGARGARQGELRKRGRDHAVQACLLGYDPATLIADPALEPLGVRWLSDHLPRPVQGLGDGWALVFTDPLTGAID